MEKWNEVLRIATGLILGLSIGIVSNQASARSGFYLAGTAGLTFPEDLKATGDLDGLLGDVDVDGELDRGYAFFGALGYSFDFVRIEIEGGYRHNDADSISTFGQTVNVDGDVEILSGMVNAYAELPLTGFSLPPVVQGFRPYVGGGIGVARASINDLSAEGLGIEDEDATIFGYQVMAGVGYDVTDYLTVTAGYRYFGTPDYETTFEEEVLGIPLEAELDVDGASIHSAEIGLRLTF